VPLITFLSDFGRHSPYPAAMKGAAAAALAGAPAVFVDISRDVPARDIRCGAYLLWSAAPAFPAGTVHCAVVDPGVGTSRAALAVSSGAQWFVGPDNGLLMPAARRLGAPAVVRLAVPRTASATFHGRDVFAPAAAALARGAASAALGGPARTFVDIAFPAGRRVPGGFEGEVLWVDTFGNVITTIPGALLDAVPAGTSFRVDAGGALLHAAVARTFGDVAPGHGLVFVGSDGVVEVAINGGSAGAALAAAPGDLVRLRPRARGGAPGLTSSGHRRTKT
jgi:S-adenosylmethionine hydrolase